MDEAGKYQRAEARVETTIELPPKMALVERFRKTGFLAVGSSYADSHRADYYLIEEALLTAEQAHRFARN